MVVNIDNLFLISSISCCCATFGRSTYFQPCVSSTCYTEIWTGRNLKFNMAIQDIIYMFDFFLFSSYSIVSFVRLSFRRSATSNEKNDEEKLTTYKT